MIDAIVYVANYAVLVEHLSIHHRELLARDDNGGIAQPPVVTGFARTPAVKNGDAVMAYARFRDEEASRWRGMPGVEVLAEAEYTGEGTADAVYARCSTNRTSWPSTTASTTAAHDKCRTARAARSRSRPPTGSGRGGGVIGAIQVRLTKSCPNLDSR